MSNPDLLRMRMRQSLNLDTKILLSERRIHEWVSHWGKNKTYVSFSGGKDSTVLLHMVRKLYPEIKAVFVDTGLEYPEIKTFVGTFDNVEIVRPKKNFTQVIKDHGYPVISKNVSRYVRDLQNPTSKNKKTRDWRLGLSPKKSKVGTLSKKWRFLVDAPFKCSEQCCDIMKKRPIHKFQKDNKMAAPILGLMAEESMTRLLLLSKNGCNSFNQKKPQSRPLSFWTEQDILHYLHRNKLEFCSVYGKITKKKGIYSLSGVKRTGCMFCMFGVSLEKSPNRFQQMKKSHPQIHNYCMNQLGCKQVLEYIGVDWK